MMPIVWWGDIKQLKDGSLVAGVYPTFYQDMEGNILNTTTSFYKSRDMGRHWEIVGVIPHQKDNGISRLFDASDGFCEPTFEILKDGSYLCVMRTGWTTPMVRSFSSDGGQHWTEPEPFTSNGVLPNLLLLDNGVLVLASGRPGIQLRFCLDGKGKKWTEPIEMMPYQDEDGQYDIWGCTCGYPDIIKIDKNTFYMTYSDFLTKNIKGESRKSIVFRRIEVIKQP